MKKEIGEAKPGKRGKTEERGKRRARAGLRLPGLPDGVKKLLGPRPIIRYSHQAALKLFESLGFKFEVRHLGESRLGLLRWPLRKTAPGTVPRRLVMVPGFGDTPLSWWSVLAGLRPVLQREVDEVVLVDYPGYSGFLHDEAAFDSMDELIRVFCEVVDTLKPEILIGHSLGAWLATEYAIARPDRVRRLFLVDPGGLCATEEDRANFRGVFERAVTEDFKHLLPHIFAKAPLLMPLFEEEFFAFLKTAEVRDFVLSFDDRHLLNDRLAAVRAETTLIWGERDTIAPSAWIEHWLARLPADVRKKGILIRGSGHSPQVEKPGVLIALFTQIFLGGEAKNLAFFPLWKVV